MAHVLARLQTCTIGLFKDNRSNVKDDNQNAVYKMDQRSHQEVADIRENRKRGHRALKSHRSCEKHNVQRKEVANANVEKPCRTSRFVRKEADNTKEDDESGRHLEHSTQQTTQETQSCSIHFSDFKSPIHNHPFNPSVERDSPRIRLRNSILENLTQLRN